jgi:hypothetical protein
MINGSGPQQQRTYEGSTPVQITLPLQTWSIILNLLGDAPWKTADPLIKAVNEQIGAVLQKVEPVEAPRERVM